MVSYRIIDTTIINLLHSNLDTILILILIHPQLIHHQHHPLPYPAPSSSAEPDAPETSTPSDSHS